MQQKPENFSAIWADVQKYIHVRTELLKLSVLEKVAKLAADLITNTIVLLCMIMAFLGSAVTLAFYLSSLFDSYTRGFGCAAVFFALLALLVNWKKAVFERFISGVAIRRYFEKFSE